MNQLFLPIDIPRSLAMLSLLAAFAAGLLAFPRIASPAFSRVVIPIDIMLPEIKAAKYPEGPQPGAVNALARKWSKIFHLPKSWIRSQAWVESKDIPTATNPATGAMGVMQIMPRTYAWLLPSLKRTTYMKNKLVRTTLAISDTGSIANLHDVDFNIMLSAYLMAILKKKLGNDHRLVAAAYDAGHVRILRCLDEGTPFPPQVEEYIARVEDAKRRGYM